MRPKRMIHPEGRPAKAATKRSTPDQIGKGNRRHISVTENPPAPAKKRGMSRITKTPVKRRTASVHDYEQEQKPACLSGSRNDSPGSERFDDSDKFCRLLGKSRRETFTHLLNPHLCMDMSGGLYGAVGQIRLKIKLRHLPLLEVSLSCAFLLLCRPCWPWRCSTVYPG